MLNIKLLCSLLRYTHVTIIKLSYLILIDMLNEPYTKQNSILKDIQTEYFALFANFLKIKCTFSYRVIYFLALCKHLSILLCSLQTLVNTTWLFANSRPYYFALCKPLSILLCSSQALVHTAWLLANTCPYYFALCKQLSILLCSSQALVHSTWLFANTCPYFFPLCQYLT